VLADMTGASAFSAKGRGGKVWGAAALALPGSPPKANVNAAVAEARSKSRRFMAGKVVVSCVLVMLSP